MISGISGISVSAKYRLKSLDIGQNIGIFNDYLPNIDLGKSIGIGGGYVYPNISVSVLAIISAMNIYRYRLDLYWSNPTVLIPFLQMRIEEKNPKNQKWLLKIGDMAKKTVKMAESFVPEY